MINGWTIYAHPLFLDQLDALIAEVEALRAKDPQGYGSKNASKRLAAITRLMLQDIPRTPAARSISRDQPLALRIATGDAPSSFSSTACSSGFTPAHG